MIDSAGASRVGYRRLVAMQVALAAILVGLLLMGVGAAAPQRQPQPAAPARTWRPATEQERREWERQQLIEEMDRLRSSPYATP